MVRPSLGDSKEKKVISGEEFIRNLSDSGLLTSAEIERALAGFPAGTSAEKEAGLAQLLTANGRLTAYQAEAVRDRRFSELIIGNYEVLDRLGAGGMGTVFKARHRRMKRIVALKILFRTQEQSDTFVQRFQREVETLSRLTHPNIVMAFDADEAEAGHFLVMEYVNGRDLAFEVYKRGPLKVLEAVECIAQAAEAMEYAHGLGIIHRDIKPANLLRDVHGVVKVADLGLARLNTVVAQPAADAGTVTQAGTVMGTVDYMPPEQAVDSKSIDHRADIYSLGCTLYFLLTGRPPYQGELLSVLLQHRESPIPSLCASRLDVSPELDTIFQCMAAKKAADRYPSMREVAQALRHLATTLQDKAEQTADDVIVPLGHPVASATAPTVAAPALPDVQLQSSETVDLTSSARSLAGTATVLLVEPSRAQSVLICKYLQDLGMADVPTTTSGQKALEIMAASQPRGVICALHLTDMTGIQLVQKMRADQRFTKVGFVLISSLAHAQEASIQCQGLNTVLLPKPFDLDQLSQALKSALDQSAEGKPSRDQSTGNRSRVLVVDDSVAARNHIRQVLTSLGYCHIIVAIDGSEAVSILDKQYFDLVVTDYNMPNLDGLGLVEFIRQRSAIPTVPILMVTTETDAAKREAVRRQGVSAICDKGFKLEVVRGILDKLLPRNP